MDSTVRTFAIGGRTFATSGNTAVELLTVEGASVAIVGVAAMVATAQARPVSREEALALGAQERAARDHAIANAHGRPVALPEPSPFIDAAYVSHLPTQAELDRGATISPLPEAGAPPLLEARAPKIDLEHAQDKGATKTALDQCRAGGFQSFDSQAKLEKHLLGQGKYAGTADERWELHHLVEQGRGSPRFGSETVQNEVNGIYLPEDVHGYISKEMSSRFLAPNGELYSQMRDWVSTLPYDAQRNLGMKMVRDALDKTNAPREVRDIVEKEIKELDHPELRDFCKNIPEKPPLRIDPAQLQPFIDQHNDSRDNRLPAARDVKPWDGTARDGTFLDIGSEHVVQHQGQGKYALMDVQRDLGGVQPPNGQYASVAAIGQVQSFQIGPQGPSAPGMGSER